MHSFVDIQSGKAYNGCMDMPKKEDVIMADKVLAGEYTGAEIKVSANGQSAYVLAPGEQAHYIHSFTYFPNASLERILSDSSL